jgi:hypothetical protein
MIMRINQNRRKKKKKEQEDKPSDFEMANSKDDPPNPPLLEDRAIIARS